MPPVRAVLAPILPALALAVSAAPARAWQPPPPAGTGGADVQEIPDGGGVLPATPLGDLLDLLTPPPAPDPVAPVQPLLPATTTIIPGTVARLRTDGRVAIPRGVPKRVRRLIARYNQIVGKRYKWGGGHAVVDDEAYDCSGAVGYGLIKTGVLSTTMVSGDFSHWGSAGPGRWVTTYSTRTHVYTEVAGLRLDTSPYGDPQGASGVRWRPLVGARRSFHVRHPIGF